MAVLWPDREGRLVPGVYIWRRDSASRLVDLIGRRALAEHPARFMVSDASAALAITVESKDGCGSIAVRAVTAPDLENSVFESLPAGREFFEHGGPGFTRAGSNRFSGVGLKAASWEMSPMRLADVHSPWLSDNSQFPPGTAEPDSAFVMRRTESCWRSVPDLIA